MKIFICGIDGYIGWPLANYLSEYGYKISGIDNLSRRTNVCAMGSSTLIPIDRFEDRQKQFDIQYFELYPYCELLKKILHEKKPDVIVHLAELPSAPFSQRCFQSCYQTQANNVLGTLTLLWAMKEAAPDAHLVKIGTMGEYGTPDIDIVEGDIDITLNGRTDTFMFPKNPGSFYHLSKVHDTNNIRFVCDTWGFSATDIMQGVVFGASAYGVQSRFDYDEHFGTVINRFCAQAVSENKLTIYGTGRQIRGFLPLEDSLQCLRLIIENPPEPGEHRIIHQFENIYSINKLASSVALNYYKITGKRAFFDYIHNPRSEKSDHYYNPEHEELFDMGYIPSEMDSQVKRLIEELIPYKDNVRKEVLYPKTTWK